MEENSKKAKDILDRDWRDRIHDGNFIIYTYINIYTFLERLKSLPLAQIEEIFMKVSENVLLLKERLTYKRISFIQTALVNSLLVSPEKDGLMESLKEAAKSSLADTEIRRQAELLIRKLSNKNEGFFRDMYIKKLLGGGIYTCPSLNLEK